MENTFVVEGQLKEIKEIQTRNNKTLYRCIVEHKSKKKTRPIEIAFFSFVPLDLLYKTVLVYGLVDVRQGTDRSFVSLIGQNLYLEMTGDEKGSNPDSSLQGDNQKPTQNKTTDIPVNDLPF